MVWVYLKIVVGFTPENKVTGIDSSYIPKEKEELKINCFAKAISQKETKAKQYENLMKSQTTNYLFEKLSQEDNRKDFLSSLKNTVSYYASSACIKARSNLKENIEKYSKKSELSML